MRNPKNSKTQVTIAVNFTSSKYNDEEHVMHSKSDNIEIKINHKEDEVIEKFSVTFFQISYWVQNVNERWLFHI